MHVYFLSFLSFCIYVFFRRTRQFGLPYLCACGSTVAFIGFYRYFFLFFCDWFGLILFAFSWSVSSCRVCGACDKNSIIFFIRRLHAQFLNILYRKPRQKSNSFLTSRKGKYFFIHVDRFSLSQSHTLALLLFLFSCRICIFRDLLHH